MNRADNILYHPVFREKLAEIDRLEEQRIFCRHGIEHLLAVARLAHLSNLEQGLGLSKELIYAAALLHDIGRGEQYLHGTPHELAGAELAGPILADCGFSGEERERLLSVIRSHRKGDGADPLAEILHRADKKCRPCYLCPAAGACNWPEEKRNRTAE